MSEKLDKLLMKFGVFNVQMKNFTCKRCGACCVDVPCSHGDNNTEDGVCKYLLIHKDKTTSCGLIINGSCTPEDVGVTGHCVIENLRINHGINHFHEKAEIFKMQVLKNGGRKI